jgi:hypothetical protein
MLNFKDWKIAGHDGQKATLKHANGHEMTIALKALPKIQKEQILRLAKASEYKDGGSVQKFDDDPNLVSADNSDDDAKPSQSTQAAGGTHITINAAPATAAPAPVVAPAANPAAAYAAKPVNVTAPEVSNAVPNLNANGTMNPSAVAQNAQEAVKGQQAIDVAKTGAAVPIEQGYIGGVGDTQKNAQALYNQMSGHVEDFNKYIQANPINPNAYVENMGDAKKTLTGLGLILGGVGAGQLGSTDNPALRFLNSQIDRDIEGQKSRINNQRTVLGAYNDLYGEGVTANNLTRASLLDVYGHKAQLLADQLGTPQAKVNAQQLGANIALEKSKLLQDSAVDLANLPGSHPTSSDVGAANVPHGTNPATGASVGSQMAQAQAGHVATEPYQAVHGNGEAQTAGIPSPGKEPTKLNPLDTVGDNNNILHPDAEHRLNNLRYGAPKDRQDFEMARSQFDQAFNADQQLKQVNGLYKRLYGETNGLSGRLHRGVNPHAIAAGAGGVGTGIGALAGTMAGGAGAIPGGIAGASIGTALGEAAGHGLQAMTNSGKNQEYDRDLEALKGIISASLKNRGDMTVEEAVQKFAPTDRDTAEQAMKKREEFKKFISSHIDKGIISLHGIAERQK